MQGNLLNEFEKLLDVETQRVVSVLTEKYFRGEILNCSFEEAIRNFVKKEYRYYSCEIELRAYRFIPQGLVPDSRGNNIFLTKEDANEEHLIHYITYCKEKGDKNHINAAKILANEIIEYYEKIQIIINNFKNLYLII